MFEFEIIDNFAVLTKYRGQDDHVEVPASYKDLPVAAIAGGAFSGVKTIKTVLLPKTIKNIGRHAFAGCSVEWIGCHSKEESLDNGISVINATYIGEAAFYRSSLRDVIMSCVVDVGNLAFAETRRLCNVVFSGEKPVNLGNKCFSNSSLQSIVLPELDILPFQCFQGCCELRNLRFQKATVIDSQAFLGCIALREMPLPDGLNRIGSAAFGQCTRITRLNIPKELEFFSPDAFEGTDISLFDVHPDNQYFVSGKKGAILNRNGDTLLAFPPAVSGNLTLDEGIIENGESAFLCSHLQYIELPNTLKVIRRDAFKGSQLVEATLPKSVARIGMNAYTNCHALIEISIPSGLEVDIEDSFYNVLIKTVHYRGSADEFKQYVTGEFLNDEVAVFFLDEDTGKEYQVGFQKTNLLFDYTLYGGTCRIDKVKAVFNHITIPEEIDSATVVAIGEFAFPMCTDSAFIPNSVREMEFGALGNAPFIKKLSVPIDLFIDPIELPSRCEVERRC